MNSYTGVGVAHAELLLGTCLKRKTLRGFVRGKVKSVGVQLLESLSSYGSSLYKSSVGRAAIYSIYL
jgi:hypothetical protein